MKKRISVEIGQVSGRLTVIKELENKYRTGKSTRMVQCECECGKIVDIPFHGIRSGNHRSCGCLLKDIHGKIANGTYKEFKTHKELNEPLIKQEES